MTLINNEDDLNEFILQVKNIQEFDPSISVEHIVEKVWLDCCHSDDEVHEGVVELLKLGENKFRYNCILGIVDRQGLLPPIVTEMLKLLTPKDDES